MISAVIASGKCKFMMSEKSVNDMVFITFLKRLLDDFKSPIFLILDNHPIHKSKRVTKFLDSINSKSKTNPRGKLKMKLFFLPPYSPELNPDELVWNHVKNHGLSRTIVSSVEQLKSTVQSKLHQLQKLPEKVMGKFNLLAQLYIAVNPKRFTANKVRKNVQELYQNLSS